MIIQNAMQKKRDGLGKAQIMFFQRHLLPCRKKGIRMQADPLLEQTLLLLPLPGLKTIQECLGQGVGLTP